MGRSDKPLVWWVGEVKTPPFGKDARIEAGYRLRQLQRGENLALPHSRPMPVIGSRCHELRIDDGDHAWRIFYRTDEDAIVEVYPKKTGRTPKAVIDRCKARLKAYDEV